MSDSRRASDELLLGMIREGRHDAEIAVRLGITTGELRERKADLRNRLGAERYLSMTGGSLAAKSPSRRRWLVRGAALGTGAFALVLAVANIVTGRPDAAEPGLASMPTAATSTVAALNSPHAVTIDGRAFDDFGRVFLPASGGRGGILATDNRAALSVVRLSETAYLSNAGSVQWSLRSTSLSDAYLRANTLGRQLDFAIHAEDDAILRAVAPGAGPVLEVQRVGGQLPATLLVRATEGRAPVEVQVTDDGRLLVAREPMAAETVLDTFTGAGLDVSNAMPFGVVPRTAATMVQNGCERPRPMEEAVGLRCRVVWLRANRGLTVPVDGVYTCTGARSVEFRGSGVRLVFLLRGEASSAFACQPTEVAAGSTIVPDGEWVVLALDAEDNPLSIVVALSGQVYVGTVRGDVSCPCLPP